jgi:hypothetical protein
MDPIKCFMLVPTGLFEKRGESDLPLYRREDTGETMTWWEAPAGAMMYADHWHETQRGPDGHLLAVRVPMFPGGKGTTNWIIDGPSSEDKTRNGWDRKGTPPDIDVYPSVWINKPSGWHGWLKDGHLVEYKS